MKRSMRSSAILVKVGTDESINNTFHYYYLYSFTIDFYVIGSFGKVQKINRISDNKTLVWKEMNYGIMTEKEK